MDHDVPEGHVIRVEVRRHDHSGHPEADDVAVRDKDAVGIERLEPFVFIRPAQRGVRPESRAEPGVQNVLFLLDLGIGKFGFRLVSCL